MRAILVERLGSLDDFVLREIESPRAGEGEVRIEVRAAGCNFSDLLMSKGEYQVRPELPFVPGGEVAGIVNEVGAGVEGLAMGDRVLSRCGIGGYAEEVVASAATTWRMPDGMSFEAGAALPTVYPTAYAALAWRAPVQPGETLLVHAAAGATGLAAVQVGKALGARVLATAGGAEKGEVACRAGADLAIDYRVEDFVARVLEETDGRGADVIFDTVGGETTDRSLKCIAWNGRLLVIGFASGAIPEIKLNRVLLKNISLVGLHWSAYPEREPERIGECFAGLFELARRGGIEPLVSARFPLERAGEALRQLGARESVGKLVLVP
jgi:NADPH2:quinone reductase